MNGTTEGAPQNSWDSGIRATPTAALGDWLGGARWDYFITLTFRDNVDDAKAVRLRSRFLNVLNRMLMGVRWKGHPPHGVYWVCGTERQARGAPHFHLLVNLVNARCAFDRPIIVRLTKVWQSHGGGFVRIEKVRSPEAVAAYVAKGYGRGADVTFSDNDIEILLGHGRRPLGRVV